MISDRMSKIIKELNNSKKSYINSIELADMLGVSSRTVKRDLKEISEILKDNGAEVEATNQGYRLIINEDELFSQFIDENISSSAEVSGKKSDKVNGILELLLSNLYINQDKIADELYISRSSINKVMMDVKNILSEYKITIQNKPHYGYILEGNEIDIRNCMVRFLTQRKEDNSILISNRLVGFKEEDYYNLLEEIKNIFKDLKIRKNDIEINYITRYIVISIFRVKYNCEIVFDDNINISLDNSVISASKTIAKKIKERFKVEFTFEDILYISYIIGNNHIEIKELDDSGISVEQMVIHAIDKIKNEYDIDFFRDGTLLKGLINHLYTSYSRYCLNVTLDNPLINLIKSKYIEAYNYSILFSKVFKEEYGISMTEEDIGYIALHFAASLERYIMNNSLKAIIVCSSGVGTAELLKTRITKKFQNIAIKGVYPAYILDSLELSDIDLIISTVNLEGVNLEKEVINVSPLLTDEDEEKINEHVKKQRDYDYLQNLMSDDLFFTNIEASSKEEVIEIMTKAMIERDIITEETKEQILKREEMSSTEITNLVAIPHCIAKENKNSVLAIGILKRPIMWDKSQVQIVFLGVLDPQVKQNRKVFSMLYKLTKKVDKIKELVNIDELSYFKKKLFK
ncbi:BglG family transcription antiterminator [Clostridium paraputrificum]|uniref:BglG family transcription antiterminator n=1 Tax=Clostridium paraputrificum TaxID=29363 RepID=UPI00232E9798|nr:BglG family transcription antiterminator [Clostridium paraputrificum]MDB2075421.1 BglG family transcription antiterminator [Clostridium paraputrificum]MDB2078543.1 BglG family transcription antiterminator [Clostridium paraputrificum]